VDEVNGRLHTRTQLSGPTEETVSLEQARIAAELRRMAELLERHPVTNTALLEDLSAMMKRIPEIPTGRFTFAALPRELKEIILDDFSGVELLVLARVSTEWASLTKCTIKKNFNNVVFDDGAASIFEVWGEGAVARLEDAFRSMAHLRLHLTGGVTITNEFNLLASQADQNLLRAAVHNTKNVMLGGQLAMDEALFSTMYSDMELNNLEIVFPPSDEETDGAMLTHCAGSIERLSICGPNGLINVTSLVNRLAAGHSVLKKLRLESAKINHGLDPDLVAKALSCLESLEVFKCSSFDRYTTALFRAISSPGSRLLWLWLGGRSARRVREMPPGALADAVSRLQVFTIRQVHLTDLQRDALRQLPGEKVEDACFHIHLGGVCTEGQCDYYD
jgi:hypothetical protein